MHRFVTERFHIVLCWVLFLTLCPAGSVLAEDVIYDFDNGITPPLQNIGYPDGGDGSLSSTFPASLEPGGIQSSSNAYISNSLSNNTVTLESGTVGNVFGAVNAIKGNPVVCMDEQPNPLIGETLIAIPAAPGQAMRYDYQYVRNGTVTNFMFSQPLGN